MVAFARARTRTLISRFWPNSPEIDNTLAPESKENNQERSVQNEKFFNAIKNGGIWFS
tara:strand:+ start:172 stop:345 length:174 start_codon:yes stop_codon:yes gene_type:complete